MLSHRIGRSGIGLFGETKIVIHVARCVESALHCIALHCDSNDWWLPFLLFVVVVVVADGIAIGSIIVGSIDIDIDIDIVVCFFVCLLFVAVVL